MSEKVISTSKEKMEDCSKSVGTGDCEAGRANPALLDKVVVDYYGTATPLNQLSNISAPERDYLLSSLGTSRL